MTIVLTFIAIVIITNALTMFRVVAISRQLIKHKGFDEWAEYVLHIGVHRYVYLCIFRIR